MTDLDQVELTKLSYEALNVGETGETVVVAGKKIGQLTRDVYTKDGMQAF